MRPQIGKQPKTKALGRTPALTRPGKPGTEAEPLARLKPGVTPLNVPSVEKLQDFSEVFDKLLKSMTPQEQNKLLERVAENYTSEFQKNHGLKFTKDNVCLVLNKINEKQLREVRQEHENLKAKLYRNSTVPNKENHMRMANEAKQKLAEKLKTTMVNFDRPSLEQSIELDRLRNDYTLHLMTALGAVQKIEAERKISGKTDFDLVLEQFAEALPKFRETVVDEDIGYLEELDKITGLKDFDSGSRSPQFLQSVKLTQKQARRAAERENYEICSMHPLLNEEEASTSEAMFPLVGEGTGQTLMVDAKTYNANQILNRNKEKLTRISNRSVRPILMRVVIIGAKRDWTGTEQAVSERLEQKLTTLPREQSSKILSSFSAFEGWRLSGASGTREANDPDIFRERKLELYEHLLRSCASLRGAAPESPSTIKVSKHNWLNVDLLITLWGFFVMLKSLFSLFKIESLTKKIKDYAKIPDFLPTRKKPGDANTPPQPKPEPKPEPKPQPKPDTQPTQKVRYKWSVLAAVAFGVCAMTAMVYGVSGMDFTPSPVTDINSAPAMYNAEELREESMSTVDWQRFSGHVNTSLAELNEVTAEAWGQIAGIYDRPYVNQTRLSDFVNVEDLSPEQVRTFIYDEAMARLYAGIDSTQSERVVTDALELIKMTSERNSELLPEYFSLEQFIVTLHRDRVQSGTAAEKESEVYFMNRASDVIQNSMRILETEELRRTLQVKVTRMHDYRVRYASTDTLNAAKAAYDNYFSKSNLISANLTRIFDSMKQLQSVQSWAKKYPSNYAALTVPQRHAVHHLEETIRLNPLANETEIEIVFTQSFAKSIPGMLRTALQPYDRQQVKAMTGVIYDKMRISNVTAEQSSGLSTWVPSWLRRLRWPEWDFTLVPDAQRLPETKHAYQEMIKLTEKRAEELKSAPLFNWDTYRSLAAEMLTIPASFFTSNILDQNDLSLTLLQVLPIIYTATGFAQSLVGERYPGSSVLWKPYSVAFQVAFASSLANYYFGNGDYLNTLMATLSLPLTGNAAVVLLLWELISKQYPNFSSMAILQSLIVNKDMVTPSVEAQHTYWNSIYGSLPEANTTASILSSIFTGGGLLLGTLFLGKVTSFMFGAYQANRVYQANQLGSWLSIPISAFSKMFSFTPPVVVALIKISTELFPYTTELKLVTDKNGNEVQVNRPTPKSLVNLKKRSAFWFLSSLVAAYYLQMYKSQNVLETISDPQLLQWKNAVTGIEQPNMQWFKESKIWKSVDEYQIQSENVITLIKTRQQDAEEFFAHLSNANSRRGDGFMNYSAILEEAASNEIFAPIFNYTLGVVQQADQFVMAQKIGETEWQSLDSQVQLSPDFKVIREITLNQNNNYTLYEPSRSDSSLGLQLDNGRVMWVPRSLFTKPKETIAISASAQSRLGQGVLEETVTLTDGTKIPAGEYDLVVEPDGRVKILQLDEEPVSVPAELLSDVVLDKLETPPVKVTEGNGTNTVNFTVTLETTNQTLEVEFGNKSESSNQTGTQSFETQEQAQVEEEEQFSYVRISETYLAEYSTTKATSEVANPSRVPDQIYRVIKSVDGEFTIQDANNNTRKVSSTKYQEFPRGEFQIRLKEGWYRTRERSFVGSTLFFGFVEWIERLIGRVEFSENMIFTINKVSLDGFSFIYEGQNRTIKFPSSVYEIIEGKPSVNSRLESTRLLCKAKRDRIKSQRK